MANWLGSLASGPAPLATATPRTGKVTAARALFDLAKVRSPEEHDVHER